ncbi:MAG: D-arabinono-1,4-lactone oxidase [Pseudomonadota bacterium]
MLGRRSLVNALVQGIIANSALPALGQSDRGERKLPWRNWSGSQQCLPAARLAPASLDELQELIVTSSGTIRPVGAGHSFSPLVPTDGTLVSLARLSGLVQHDSDTLQATVWAGTRLGEIGQPLEDVGQAMVNLPDIDEQALGGCLATATHGTGAKLGCLSSLISHLQIMDAEGNLIDCSVTKNPDIFQAAKVSLGSLGIVTQATLQNVAPFRLRKETHWLNFEDILANAERLADQHRNFEFYFIPFTGMGFTDAYDVTTEPIGATETLDDNEGVKDLMLARDALSWSPGLRKLVLGSYMRTLPSETSIESSWRNFPNERNVRFNEMEYHLPREYGLTALREIRDVLETNHDEVFFPIEFRYVQADDIWLSPFQGRDCCSIAIHRYFEEDYGPYFKAIEPIFRKYHGRPHWGKLNTLNREDFADLYPHWEDFIAVRNALDPQGRFLNPYLHSLLG